MADRPPIERQDLEVKTDYYGSVDEINDLAPRTDQMMAAEYPNETRDWLLAVSDMLDSLPQLDDTATDDALRYWSAPRMIAYIQSVLGGAVLGRQSLEGEATIRERARTRTLPAGAAVYCDPNATGLGDGSDWENAFNDMSSAFAALADNGRLYTNAPQSAPFPKQVVNAVPNGVEWISNAGPDQVTWVDGRMFGTWGELEGIYYIGVPVEPDYVAYDMRQDDVTGTITGVDVTQPEYESVIKQWGYDPRDLVAWYGFLEKESVATESPSVGKWSWIAGVVYVNPPAGVTADEMNSKACWSDSASGVLLLGDRYEGLYHHGDLRTFWTPAIGAPEGYGLRLTNASKCTIADHIAYLSGYHSIGFTGDSGAENAMVRCLTVGEVASDLNTAQPYVFYTADQDYGNARHVAHDMLFLAFPALNYNGAPLTDSYSPALGLSHTAGLTVMPGVRWHYCAQLDFVQQLEERHSVTISYTVGSISGMNFGSNPSVDDVGDWPISVWDSVFIGKCASPRAGCDYRRTRFDRLDYGDSADLVLNMGAPVGSDTNVLRMIGGAWGAGKCYALIASQNANDSTALRGVRIGFAATGSTSAVFYTTEATSDMRMGDCSVVAGDDYTAIALLSNTAWGTDADGISSIFTSEGGNVYDSTMQVGIKHTNDVITPKTVQEFLTATDLSSADGVGYLD